MRLTKTARIVIAPTMVAILMVTAQGMGLHLWHSEDSTKLGSQSADFYRKGSPYVDSDYESPSWKALISMGRVPYHQLSQSDFRPDDEIESKDGVFTDGFIVYTYRYRLLPQGKSQIKATLTDFKVLSGLSTKTSWRRSKFTDPTLYLHHEQGHQDINELAAHTLAAMIADEKPEGIGNTRDEAVKNLDAKVTDLYAKVAQKDREEQAAYDQETHSGWDKEAQAKATNRLNAQLKNAGIRDAWTGRSQKVDQLIF